MNDPITESLLSDKLLGSGSRFPYDRLDAETRTLIVTRAGEIKFLTKQNAENIIQIGVKLKEVKEVLGHGQFGKWLAAEFEWTVRTAQQFMNVAETFKYENFSYLDFAPSALYLLAAPSTPDAARTGALERAQAGDHITHAIAKKIVAEVKATQPKREKRTPGTKQSSPLSLEKLLQDKPWTQAEDKVGDSDETSYKPSLLPGIETPDIEIAAPDTTTKDSSSCQWIRDAMQRRLMKLLLDADDGMRIEQLAKERGKLPVTIVALGIEALAAAPGLERKITELEIRLQDMAASNRQLVQEAMQEKDAQIAELERALLDRDLRVEELEESCAQKENTIEKITESLNEAHATCTALENEKMELAVQLDEQIAQSDASLDKVEGLLVAQQEKLRYLEARLQECQAQVPVQQPVPINPTKPIITTLGNVVPNLKPLIEFFDVAAQKLEKPSIQLHLNDHTLVIARNSRSYKGNHVGCLNINDWEGNWHGRINRDGRLYKAKEWQDWVMPILVAFAANPVEVAQQHGKKTGSCCFCNHALSDPNSLATGYGETCAKHYGLPYPHLAVAP